MLAHVPLFVLFPIFFTQVRTESNQIVQYRIYFESDKESLQKSKLKFKRVSEFIKDNQNRTLEIIYYRAEIKTFLARDNFRNLDITNCDGKNSAELQFQSFPISNDQIQYLESQKIVLWYIQPSSTFSNAPAVFVDIKQSNIALPDLLERFENNGEDIKFLRSREVKFKSKMIHKCFLAARSVNFKNLQAFLHQSEINHDVWIDLSKNYNVKSNYNFHKILSSYLVDRCMFLV